MCFVDHRCMRHMLVVAASTHPADRRGSSLPGWRRAGCASSLRRDARILPGPKEGMACP